MPPAPSASRTTSVHPRCAVEGGRITIAGADFPTSGDELPNVSIGHTRARVVYASPTELSVLIPSGVEGGSTSVTIDGAAGDRVVVDIATTFATGLHQVDNPVFDSAGNLYVTYSGTRGQQVPVSIFRVRPNGTRETFSSGVVNPTSIAIGPDGHLYVSSRFEGTVYRLGDDGSFESFASDLGIACGLVFAPDGTLFVGDRSGTIFRVSRTGDAKAFATLPSSVAAFHLALGPDGALYVTGPTLSSYDAVYRIDNSGAVQTYFEEFGRPQGLAFDRQGRLHVIEALAGVSGLYRVSGAGKPELVVSGPGLVGVAFGDDSVIVCSNDTAYRFPAASLE